MRIHKTLEQAKDDLIRVGDIIYYCNKAAETSGKLAAKCIRSEGKGESRTSSIGGAAYFFNQEEIFRYHIPNVITCIINAPLQTDEDREEENE